MRVIEEAIALFLSFFLLLMLLIEPFSGCLCSFCPFILDQVKSLAGMNCYLS